MDNDLPSFWGLVGAFAVIALYCLPYIIARIRKHKNIQAVAACNALLGWTVIGWIVTFIWALCN